MKTIAKVLRWLGVASVLVGGVFLAFVAAYPLGLVDPYPMPPKADVSGPFGMTKKIDSVASLYRQPNEPEGDYFGRLAHSISEGIVHYWHAGDEWEPADARYTRVSPWDNYALWLHSFIPGYEHFNQYEFMTPEKAIARGYGFCSQVSRIAWSVLSDQDMQATVLSNAQHVIVEADGQLVDPDYGVYIPHDAAWMQANADAAVPLYYRDFPWMIPLLTQIYKEGWYDTDPNGTFDYMRRYEAKFDLYKWFPPIILIIGGAVLLFMGTAIGQKKRPLRFSPDLV